MPAARGIRHGLIVFALSALAACGGQNVREMPATYTVKRGDTLYSIAWRHDLDYRDLARWNRLPADFQIHPGQVLSLRPGSGAPAAVKPAPRTQPAKPKAAKPAPAPKPPVIPPEERVANWMWPLAGNFRVQPQTAIGSPSLVLFGTEGQPVRAAAAGKVVYTGSGMRGFGNLIIVKHSGVFLTAYGHNRDLEVKEGDTVTMGQKLAEMGIGPGQQPALYFEIRVNGRPVDPLPYLPRR